MGLLGKLLKTGIDIAAVPVEIIKDVATLGGACVDRSEPYTWSKLKNIADDCSEVKDEVEKL